MEEYTGRMRAVNLPAMVPVLSCLSFVASLSLAVPPEDLPLLEPGVSAFQVSSHNKKGLNGDGGWYLHEGEEEGEGLVAWSAIDDGASAAYTKERVFAGKGALVHTVRLKGLATGWRSV